MLGPSAVRGLFVALLFISVSARAQSSSEAPSALVTPDTRQLLVVRSSSWSAQSGTLKQYARDTEGRWDQAGAEIPVSLGRNGMAWGRGIHPSPKSGPSKKEGDGRSPAGVFLLERAFGVGAALPMGAHDFPYLRTLSSTYCVEDTHSPFYNRIIDSTEVNRTSWEKWSELRRTDGLFDWGIMVSQNAPDTLKGAGSCVFLHVWRGPGSPTAGCTAMAREQVEAVLRWLEPKAKPLLVQLPSTTYDELRAEWALP